MTNLTTLFMYGTLMRGQSRHSVIGGCNFLGEAVTSTEGYTMWKYRHGGFPVVLPSNDYCHSVHGELYEVDDGTIETLDWIEGRGFMYDLNDISVRHKGEDMMVKCYMGIPSFWADERKNLELADVVDGFYVFQ